ncbi:MAG: FAD-dependent oxidoreductase [Acidobacteria bacterium]|nr:FAD-dependent oxidoreductase [Acidobacteriota bacterium]
MKKKKRKTGSGRRKFLKGLGSGALLAAAGASTSCSTPGAVTDWSSTVDWISVGAGAAGPAAAIFGHDKGFKTLLLEKADVIGGRASQSGGILYVLMNHLMKEAGIPDSREEALNYFRYTGAGYNSPEHVEAYVDHAARAVEYLQQKADVKFRMSELIDFWAPFSEGGWRLDENIAVGSKRLGRSLICEPFPAETLSNWRDKVRLSVFYHGLGEALEGQEHNPSLMRLTKGATLGPSVGHSGPIRGSDSVALALWRKRLGAKLDAMLKKDEEQRVAGASLAAYLFRAVLQRGIEVRLETRAERLLVENGRVVGVTVHHRGREENIKANRGVVLATGGGDGWKLAACATGAVYSEIRIQGLGNLRVPGEKNPDGSPVSRGNYELRMRHSLVVNRFGERFADEVPYQGLGTKLLDFDSHREHRFRNLPNYFLFDSQLIEKYSFAGRPPGATEDFDWVEQERTLADLAQKLNLPAAKLEATVSRFNGHARRGRDTDFHRRPETLGPLEKPPFYGVQAMRPDHDPFRASTSIVTDTHGQVLHAESRKPIPGLYASGTVQEDHGVVGVGYHAGMHLGMAVAFSLLAAEHAASV